MTYQEAEFQLSKEHPNPFENNGQIRQTIVVPKLEKDFIKFISDIRERKANLKDVVKYSTNTEYTLWSGDTEFYNIIND